MSEGLVFSIEEFSIYDGPGIRTTVFLKGCPLRCAWCHSPDGQTNQIEWIRSPNGCLGCNACLKKGLECTGKPILVEESANVCPRRLIRKLGEKFTPSELIERLSKNVSILNRSNGGITFSGGEPLSQAVFLQDCLKRLNGLTHRAIQTSGFCDPAVFSNVLKDCDLVLFDLKLMDPDLHRRYCGQDNRWIQKNYATLATGTLPFQTRVPLIPDVTDTVENITAIAHFMNTLKVHSVELLPYHKFTGSKYAMMGRRYTPPFKEEKAPEPHLCIFERYGIEVTIL